MVRAIQMDALLLFAIVNDDVKAAGHGNEELMAFFKRVAAPVRAAGHIVKVEHAFDIKRHMVSTFNKSQVAARVVNFWQVNKFAVGQVHRRISWMDDSEVFWKWRPQAQTTLTCSWKFNFSLQRQTQTASRAGLPRTSACEGTSFVTTAPAAIIAQRPTVTGKRVALAPTVQPCCK